MNIFDTSKKILTVFICLFASSITSAGILWEKELVLDANTNSAPLASCLNKDASGVIVSTIECPKGSFPIKGDNILWDIKGDDAIRLMPRNIDGSKVWTNAIPVGPGCAIASDSNGNLLTVGILGKQKAEKEQKVAVISRSDREEKIVSPLNSIESHSINKMIALQDNTFALVGDRNSDGMFLRIDGQGRIIQEKLFDLGRTDIFSDIDKMANLDLAIVGVSIKTSEKDPNENIAEYFLLMYDPNLKTVGEDYFTGGMPRILPKVCCLENGDIIVLYKKNNEYSKTLLEARCYTKELKLLWEKEIFVKDCHVFYSDVSSWGTEGFVVGVVQNELLEFYCFDQEGIKLDYIRYEGPPGGAVGINGFNLMRVNDRTISVFDEGTAGNIKEASMKAKVIALE